MTGRHRSRFKRPEDYPAETPVEAPETGLAL